MAKTHTIDSNQSMTVNVDHGKATWILNAGVTIAATSSPGLQNLLGGGYDKVTYQINGTIETVNPSSESGLSDYGDDNRLIIANGGKIHAAYGVSADGDNFTTINNGTVFGAQATAFLMGGGDYLLRNNGWIDGDAAATRSVIITADGVGKIVNSDTALIGASIVDQAANARTTIVNDGTISKSDFWDFSADLGGGNDRVLNRGQITGDLWMGDGNDLVDLRRGSLSGEAYGGLGNDRFFVNGIDDFVFEADNEGTDTIVTSVDWVMNNGAMGHFEIVKASGKGKVDLTGNDDGNRLTGNANNNRIAGGNGDDMLNGGGGKDTFIYTDFNGIDTIAGFKNGEDRLDVSGWNAVNNFGDVSAMLKTKGKDVWIDNGAERIVLLDTAKGEIDASDFIF